MGVWFYIVASSFNVIWNTLQEENEAALLVWAWSESFMCCFWIADIRNQPSRIESFLIPIDTKLPIAIWMGFFQHIQASKVHWTTRGYRSWCLQDPVGIPDQVKLRKWSSFEHMLLLQRYLQQAGPSELRKKGLKKPTGGSYWGPWKFLYSLLSTVSSFSFCRITG